MEFGIRIQIRGFQAAGLGLRELEVSPSGVDALVSMLLSSILVVGEWEFESFRLSGKCGVWTGVLGRWTSGGGVLLLDFGFWLSVRGIWCTSRSLDFRELGG